MKDRLWKTERVYDTLRNDLKSGVYQPGDRIEAAAAAIRLKTSVSPVRAALHRLTGERLVDAHAHGGFSVPQLTETGLREQFEWNHQVVQMALRWPTAHSVTAPQIEPPHDAGSTVAAMEQVVLQIGRRVPSAELRAALSTSIIRLHRPREIEVELMPSLQDDVRNWVNAWSAGDLRELARQMQGKHNRRHTLVHQIVDRLHQIQAHDV